MPVTWQPSLPRSPCPPTACSDQEEFQLLLGERNAAQRSAGQFSAAQCSGCHCLLQLRGSAVPFHSPSLTHCLPPHHCAAQVAVGCVLVFSVGYWILSAHRWFKGPIKQASGLGRRGGPACYGECRACWADGACGADRAGLVPSLRDLPAPPPPPPSNSCSVLVAFACIPITTAARHLAGRQRRHCLPALFTLPRAPC